MKLGIDEVLKVPYKCCCFSARSVPAGRGQNRSRGPLLQRTSSSDRKATATNRMHSSDLKHVERSVVIFGFIRKPKFDALLSLFGLCHFGVF